MDQPPQPPNPQRRRRRPSLDEMLPLIAALTGAGALLAVFAGIIIWANTITIPGH